MSEPSDQMGEVDSPPWAGLWVDGQPSRPQEDQHEYFVGNIVVIQPDFTVELFMYPNEEDMRAAWAEFEQTLEKKEPAEDDFVLLGTELTGYRVHIYEEDDAPVWVPPSSNLVDAKFSSVAGALTWICECDPNCRRHRAWLSQGSAFLSLEWP